MVNLKTGALVALVGGLVLAAAPAGAQATPASLKCSSSKQKTVGKDASAKLGCHAKAVGKGVVVDPACLDKASGKTSAGLTKAEASGACATEANAFGGNTPDLVSAVDDLVADIAGGLYDVLAPVANKCAASKAKEAGKLAAALLGCSSKAAAKNTPVAPACNTKPLDKFNAAFAKAEAKPPCLTAGDAGTIATKIQAFVEVAVRNMPRNDGCGSGFVNAPETCDDGNTVDTDGCPSDCIVDACSPIAGSVRPVTVNLASAKPVAGVTVFVDYPEGKVGIPGSGGAIPFGIVDGFPDPINGFGQPNDFDHGLQALYVQPENFAAGQLFVVDFEDCTGAPAPVAADFTCTVLGASDAALKAVKGVTCTVAP